jgi:hypothetical protein
MFPNFADGRPICTIADLQSMFPFCVLLGGARPCLGLVATVSNGALWPLQSLAMANTCAGALSHQPSKSHSRPPAYIRQESIHGKEALLRKYLIVMRCNQSGAHAVKLVVPQGCRQYAASMPPVRAADDSTRQISLSLVSAFQLINSPQS